MWQHLHAFETWIACKQCDFKRNIFSWNPFFKNILWTLPVTIFTIDNYLALSTIQNSNNPGSNNLWIPVKFRLLAVHDYHWKCFYGHKLKKWVGLTENFRETQVCFSYLQTSCVYVIYLGDNLAFFRLDLDINPYGSFVPFGS